MKTVADIMTANPYCLKDTDNLFDGRNLMRHQSIRHIPIIHSESGHFVGMLTQKKVLSSAISIITDKGFSYLQEEESKKSIADLMDTQVPVASSDMTLLEAAQFFVNNRHGCLAIVDDNKVVGVVTSGDFVKLSLHFLQQEGQE